MQNTQIFKRYGVCAIGLLISACGIAIMTKAGLGTSQISSLPYVASFILPISLGTATFAMNLAFVAAQFFLLGKDFGRHELMQIPMTFLFSAFLDAAMFLSKWIAPTFYPMQIALCLLGAVTLAFGISLQIAANVAILPGEGIVRAVSRKTGRHFGTIKTGFDIALVVSAVALSFAALHKLVGVREGTVISALTVGTIARFFLGLLVPSNQPAEK